MPKQMANQGYDKFEVSRPLLGRGKIQATRNNETREIVVNATGRVLSDTTGGIVGTQTEKGKTNKDVSRSGNIDATPDSENEEDDSEDRGDGEDGDDGGEDDEM